jgi:hypothetical protein
MRFYARMTILAALLALSGPAGAEEMKDRVKLAPETIFFTQPYAFLQPAEKDLIGLDLGLDYLTVRYQYGFANALDGKEKPLGFRQRMIVKDPEQLQRIADQSGFKVGDPVTVLSSAGRGHAAKVAGFSYLGNSPSTIIVTADLKLLGPADPTLFKRIGVAVRGAVNFPPETAIATGEPLPANDPTRQQLLGLCAGGPSRGLVISDVEVVPAPLVAGGEPYFFVSFWKRPDPDFEIDDVELESCLFRSNSAGWSKANLPLSFRLLQVQDLDRDGKAEILAEAGNGAEVCHLYLAPKGEGFNVLKKGLCAGY